MSEPFKVCPICETSNRHSASVCSTCGATLENTEKRGASSKEQPGVSVYSRFFGETDLLEDDLRHTGRVYTLGIFGFLIALMLCSLTLIAGTAFFSSGNTNSPIQPRPVNDTISTVALPTVTLAPPTLTATNTIPPSPTPTVTPTPEPCYQEVRQGDSLYAVVGRCGHQHPDVLGIVAEINNLSDVNSIREGDILEVPWPTTTPDPDASQAVSSGRSILSEDFDPLFVPTPTLPVGIQFHIVQPGEMISSIVYQYNISIEVLSQLNPEIDFSLCDLGEAYGGPRCVILLNEGQYIRVPGPTPTPALSPMFSTGEGLTPTVTSTFNAPSARSPSDRMSFQRDELVTLRWVPSGTLGAGQTYRVRVEDVTTGQVYVADTRDISFVIPEAWHGETQPRHEYIWTISVINIEAPDAPLHTTQPLTFVWETCESD